MNRCSGDAHLVEVLASEAKQYSLVHLSENVKSNQTASLSKTI